MKAVTERLRAVPHRLAVQPLSLVVLVERYQETGLGIGVFGSLKFESEFSHLLGVSDVIYFVNVHIFLHT